MEEQVGTLRDNFWFLHLVSICFSLGRVLRFYSGESHSFLSKKTHCIFLSSASGHQMCGVYFLTPTNFPKPPWCPTIQYNFDTIYQILQVKGLVSKEYPHVQCQLLSLRLLSMRLTN